MYSFATPPIKLKLGQQTTWTNHYDRPIRNTELTLFSAGAEALVPTSPATAPCAIMLSQNHFPEQNRRR
jgi:hypothetical protein